MSDVMRLFSRSDILCVNCPLNNETYHLVNAERLAMMKPTAYFIHTARGKVVDDQALVEALKEGKIAGAALDGSQLRGAKRANQTYYGVPLWPEHGGHRSAASVGAVAPPTVQLEPDSSPSKPDALGLQPEALLEAAFRGKSDAAGGRQDSMPGQFCIRGRLAQRPADLPGGAPG